MRIRMKNKWKMQSNNGCGTATPEWMMLMRLTKKLIKLQIDKINAKLPKTHFFKCLFVWINNLCSKEATIFHCRVVAPVTYVIADVLSSL